MCSVSCFDGQIVSCRSACCNTEILHIIYHVAVYVFVQIAQMSNILYISALKECDNMANNKRIDGKNAHSVASEKYNSKAYYRFYVNMKKENELIVKQYALSRNMSVNQLINTLLAAQVPGFVSLDYTTTPSAVELSDI